MDAITGFVYGMSMMFFSMMAWMFWRKGSDRLFRLIMILMLIVDAQCLKDILSFYFTGFDNEENWFLISAADMFIIPFYSFVLMELVKPGWTTWRKAVMLELPFVLLPAICARYSLGEHLCAATKALRKVETELNPDFSATSNTV